MDIECVVPEMCFCAGRQHLGGRCTGRTRTTDDVPSAGVEGLRTADGRTIDGDGVFRAEFLDDHLRLCRIDAIGTVGGRDKAVIGIIRLALIGRRMAGLRLRTGTRIRRGGCLACRGHIAVPLIAHAVQVAAFLFRYQAQIRAYRNGLRHRIQGVEERAALVVVHGTRCRVTVAYHVVFITIIVIVEDMCAGSHLLCCESRTGLGTRVWRKDEQRLVIRSRPPSVFIVPNAFFLLCGSNGVTTVAE